MVRMILRVLIPLCVVNICFTHSLPKSKFLISAFSNGYKQLKELILNKLPQLLYS